MGAAEIIREIEKLPAEEKTQVIDYVRQMADERSEVRHASDADAQAAADRVMDAHPDLLRKLAQ